MEALILTADGVDGCELMYLYYRLRQAGLGVDIAAPEKGPVEGAHRCHPIEANVSLFEMWGAEFYDVLALPGRMAPEKIRHNERVHALLRQMLEAGKVVAAIGHGVEMLVSAGVVKGKKATCAPGVRDEPFPRAVGAPVPVVSGTAATDALGQCLHGPHRPDRTPARAAVLEPSEPVRACPGDGLDASGRGTVPVFTRGRRVACRGTARHVRSIATAVEGDRAGVRLEADAACAKEMKCSHCALFRPEAQTMDVPRGGLRAGDRARLHVPARSAYRSMLVVFLLPMILVVAGMLAGVEVGEDHGGLAAAVGAIAGLAVAIAVALLVNRRLAGISDCEVERIGPASSDG